MKIALASAPFPKSLSDGLYWLEKLTGEAAALQAEIICFPESYLPGYPGMPYSPEDRTAEQLEEALKEVCRIAAEYGRAGLIMADIDPEKATGLLAMRFKKELYT